ncbi:MAG: bifunctional folylpolyglutamate synthase/dihydrofolate synthase [Prevotella sp.]|nr:bifunctional folylpolyglutamate synthase/dihydrofolate synthase [Prevotella sp.]
MNYKETTEYLFNVTPVFEKIGAGAYKEGLANSLALDEHFGHPHRRFKSIHIAGTNGKGSCSHTIAAILQAAGYKVGLYTSPHLVDFRERIRVNGACVSEQYVIDFVEQERGFFEPLHPSFFELTTAMAFKYFAEQQVDYAVIEVGLGGRLDCTNIIQPVFSVITNISFDHTQFLGNTLEKIAYEKAGIIKQGIPVVIGETVDETKPVFEDVARRMNAPISFAEAFSMDMFTDEELRKQDFEDIDFELKGLYQQKNKRTILCAIHTIEDIIAAHASVPLHTAVGAGFANVCKQTGLVGRWQTIRQAPLAICDTGHNVGGWEYLAIQVAQQPCRQRRIVFGMVDDKDINAVLAMLPADAEYYWCKASTHRAIPETRISQLAESHHLHGSSYGDVVTAYRQALADAHPDDFIFVGGSSYVVADLLAGIENC